MIAFNGQYLPAASHGNMRITAACLGGQLMMSWLKTATQQAIIAAFGAEEGIEVILETNDYLNALALTDPTRAQQLAMFVNEDPLLVTSLVETSKTRWLRWNSGTWVRTGVPYSQSIETDVVAMPDAFGTLQLIAREGGGYSSYQFSFYNGGYSASTGGSYDKTNLGFVGGNVYDIRYNAEGNNVIVNGVTYGVTKTLSGTQSIVFGTRSGGNWYVGYFGVAKIINKDTGELLRWYAPFIRNGEAILLNLLDGTPAEVVIGSFTIQITDKQ